MNTGESRVQIVDQQTKNVEHRGGTQSKVVQVPKNTPTESGWVKVEAKKIVQNLSRNSRRVVIQRFSHRPISRVEKSNLISTANRAIETSRNFCRFQTWNVNSEGTITIITREKEAEAEVLKNSSDLIREIE